MKTKNTIYLVKFGDSGYYAKHQPNYQWSFTDDPLEANPYATIKNAKARGEGSDTFTIEEWELTTKLNGGTIVYDGTIKVDRTKGPEISIMDLIARRHAAKLEAEKP